MTQREEIVSQAMSLNAEDRAFVADALERSLTTGGFATPELAAAWAKEIERRLASYDRGDVRAVDFEGALQKIRSKIAEHRAGKGSS